MASQNVVCFLRRGRMLYFFSVQHETPNFLNLNKLVPCSKIVDGENGTRKNARKFES